MGKFVALLTSNRFRWYAISRTNGSHPLVIKSYAVIQNTLYKKVGGKMYTVKLKV